MAQDLFNRYIWLVDTIYRAKEITFEEINERWQRNTISEGNELPLRTFHNWRHAIEEMFNINIECNKRGGYYYYIENAEDMERGGVRNWLLNTFAVNNLINESHHLKHRILFEEIPSGQRYLTPLIEAMRDGVKVDMTYQSFWRDKPNSFSVSPYCVKVFRQRWYLVAFNDYYQQLRIYALDRILELQLSEETFNYPEDFDPSAYFESSFGIIVDNTVNSEQVRLKVFGKQPNFFRVLPLHHSQIEVESCADYSVFEYFLKPTFDFQQEILMHAHEVEVLEPEWFREEIASTAMKMNLLYNKK